ncbi:putative pre-16S rRNA nuclease [Prolixibacter bellariivorans]|uniref:Putative pre-16S rRNA nuclease n=2 Tax=Prolixibacter bellariivorans TaxID=314319 RepID=A0A5M4B1N5_9BACT|nr:putative pre-16S rRNA nuclease [Prolixibacter bellariivorans]
MYLCPLKIKKNMGRILALDYGRKRVGVAVTDPLQLIASRLTTIATHEIWDFLSEYLQKEDVETLVIGYPVQLNNEPSESIRYINPFLKKFRKLYPDMPVKQIDERFTSKMAFQSMIDAGLRKKSRQDKAMVDAVSATIILQSYLEENKYKK